MVDHTNLPVSRHGKPVQQAALHNGQSVVVWARNTLRYVTKVVPCGTTWICYQLLDALRVNLYDKV